MKQGFVVAVVGATGAVGLELVRILEQRLFPVGELRLFASDRSAGKITTFGATAPWRSANTNHKTPHGPMKLRIRKVEPECFLGVDIAFFAAGGSVSRAWAPVAVRNGAVVIDKSSTFRMDKTVPLVVPEVNPDAIAKHKGIIASPNCSTIPLVMVLKPLNDYAKVKRVVVSTYQSVSGAGLKAVAEMEEEAKALLAGRRYQRKIFPHQIAFNVIPQIPQSNAFCPSGTSFDGYTDEEVKMIQETQKILGDSSIKVSPTCVRVPVYRGHAESVNIEFARPVSPAKARALLSKAPGIRVVDDPAKQAYPMPVDVDGKDEVLVGRIRVDRTVKNGLNLWLAGENLRKGAALNAVQIAERVIQDYK
ncbi:MAG: aspartate-semialdehyde dehydrogenase [Planctomycetota bacterium]